MLYRLRSSINLGNIASTFPDTDFSDLNFLINCKLADPKCSSVDEVNWEKLGSNPPSLGPGENRNYAGQASQVWGS